MDRNRSEQLSFHLIILTVNWPFLPFALITSSSSEVTGTEGKEKKGQTYHKDPLQNFDALHYIYIIDSLNLLNQEFYDNLRHFHQND